MGTKDMDFVQLNQLIGRKTGGISVYPWTSPVRGKADPCTKIFVRGKAMASRVEDLFNLVQHLYHSMCISPSLFLCVCVSSELTLIYHFMFVDELHPSRRPI
jgi:Peptidase M16C associated